MSSDLKTLASPKGWDTVFQILDFEYKPPYNTGEAARMRILLIFAEESVCGEVHFDKVYLMLIFQHQCPTSQETQIQNNLNFSKLKHGSTLFLEVTVTGTLA